MTATIPAELAQQLGLLEVGDETSLYAETINEDGSVYVSAEGDKVPEESSEEEEPTAPEEAPLPSGAKEPTDASMPPGVGVVIIKRKSAPKPAVKAVVTPAV